MYTSDIELRKLEQKEKRVFENKSFGETASSRAADVLGGHITREWFCREPVSERGSVKPLQRETWPHIKEGVVIPMPAGQQLHDMQREFYQRQRGDGLGPATERWQRQVFGWAQRLKRRFFRDDKQVTGLWALAAKRWKTRLARLDDKYLARQVFAEIRRGVPLPFSTMPKKPVCAKSNHRDLHLRKEQVFKAIANQLQEKALEPFDVSAGAYPKGILSMRWVAKSNPEEVRLTLNGRPINVCFAEKDCTIDLETHAQLRRSYEQDQMYVGFDLRDGFFNQQYIKEHRRWVGFRISDMELGEELARRLRALVPQAYRDGYFYFVYRGLVMGLGPSCQQLQRVTDTLLTVLGDCQVSNLSWRPTNYIDDLMAMALGTFVAALELSLRLLAELIVLGYSVNLNHKSSIVPSRFYCHIGICLNSKNLRFSLPPKRVNKIRRCALSLQAAAKVGVPIDAKLVARFVGQLWSIHIVCYRAVAIMARGMIHTIATMIRESGVPEESDLHKLKYLLRRVWGGQVVWTALAQRELDFWLAIDFAGLSAPFSHDLLSEKLTTWVALPESGELAADVRIFAVDTSDSMSGGGEFIRDGMLWKMKGKMVARLSPSEVLKSSTFRELTGVGRMDLAVVPDTCSKLLVPLDSQASVSCLLRGSRVIELQLLVAIIFGNQLRCNRVLWPVWMRRNTQIIKMVDVVSRYIDNHVFAAAPVLFWKANAYAVQLWGRGFQLDTCADMHNVQPVSSSVKLPFFSRWPAPHASGFDMFQQRWNGKVCWCNPPFALIPRVMALLKAQCACAAVVVPLGTKAHYGKLRGARGSGVRYSFTFCPSLANWQQSAVSSSSFRHNYAVLFFDFTAPPHAFVNLPSAEALPEGGGGGGGGGGEIFVIGVTVNRPPLMMLPVLLVSRNAEVYSLGFARRAARTPKA